MDALAAAAASQKPVNPDATSPTPPPASPPSTPTSRPSALSINFLVESSSSPYFVEEDAPTHKPSDHVVVVDEQLPARNKLGSQHLDEVDHGDAGQDEAYASPTTSAHRPSLFDHLLHFSHQSSTPTPSSTTSSPPSTSSRNNSPTPLPGPCVVLPRPVRPNTSLSSALPAYPPLHHHATTTATTTAAAYPYPAYYPLASFANPSAGPGATSSSTSSCSNASTLPPPVPMLTTPGSGPVIDLQFLSQLYLQASPYLLPGLFSTATATTSSSTSSSSTTMSGGHHQAGVFAQAGQQAPPGYHPGIHLQQQVFHQAMALAHLHPLPHHQHQQQQHISPPASVHRESSAALAPLTPARSLEGHVPNHQHQHQHHNHQRQSAGFSAGGDRMSALESILARAERHAQEENARNLMRGVKREKSEPRYGDDECASPPRSDRLKRRRTDSNSSDSDYSPSSAGGQRRTQSDDEHHHRGHPTFTSSSSGSSDDDDEDVENSGARRSAGKHQGVVGTGMREMLYKRRQASPKQVVLLEQVFAVEPIPTSATKLRLAEVLNMSPKRVTVWFKNKRARQKKKGIPLPNSCTTATATAATSPGGPTTTSVRTSPIDRKFPSSSASSSSPTTASSSPPPARRRGDQHLTFHFFADRDGGDSAGAAP